MPEQTEKPKISLADLPEDHPIFHRGRNIPLLMMREAELARRAKQATDTPHEEVTNGT